MILQLCYSPSLCNSISCSIGFAPYTWCSVVLSFVLREHVVLRGAPWCVVLRGALWCYVVLRRAPWCSVVLHGDTTKFTSTLQCWYCGVVAVQYRCCQNARVFFLVFVYNFIWNTLSSLVHLVFSFIFILLINFRYKLQSCIYKVIWNFWIFIPGLPTISLL